MIIKKLTIHNFGAYASTNSFEFESRKPIVLVGGFNGRGKTTFLEAVLLALYGKNSFAYTESKHKSYGKYLEAYINKSDGTLISYVDMEFLMDNKEDEYYRIHREWSGNKQRIQEEITVYKDGEYNPFLTENWTMFIENILPSGLSNFFFFDGEKIAELAVEDASDQMKDSIKVLLGISVLDMLDDDIKRIISKVSKNKVDNKAAQDIEILRREKDQIEKKLVEIDENISNVENEIDEINHKLDKYSEEYSAKGGDIVLQKQELFNKLSERKAQLGRINEQLRADAASELPLVLVKEYLMNIRENAEIEHDNRVMVSAVKKIEKLYSKYQSNSTNIEKFIEYIKEKISLSSSEVMYNLSDTSLLRLNILLDEQLINTKLDVSIRQKEAKDVSSNIEQLDSYLSVDIDEESLIKVYKKIKKAEQSKIDLEVKLDKLLENRRSINGKLMAKTTEFNRNVEAYLKKVELNDDGDRVLKYAHMASTILKEYKVRLQSRKVNEVAETMTECYKKLANKKNLINEITMDSVSLDLSYLNSDKKEVDKTSLSAGEKQLMVISLLWALALCSKKKLPVIIDTPLSRLDSAHRLALIETYFPQASNQTIILSTDSEIDVNYYNIMRENVGDEFTLYYNDETKATKIEKGYFWEVNK